MNHRMKRVMVILVGIVLLRFWPMLFGKTLFFGDNYSLMIPGKLFTATWIRQGILPLWNPHLFGGLSWIGNMNESLFSLSTLVFSLFNPAIALNITVLAHVLVTFFGMYLFSREWNRSDDAGLIAAVLWTLSTQVTGAINNLTTLQSIAWVPWILLGGLWIGKKPRAPLILGVLISLQIFGGYPQFIVYAVGFSFLLSCFALSQERKVFRQNLLPFLLQWVGAGVISLGLSAVVWIPFIESLTDSTRTIQTATQAMLGALHPAELITLGIPYFFALPLVGMKWGPQWNAMLNAGLYVGLLGLLGGVQSFFVRSRRREYFFFAVLMLGSVLFSLGSVVPGFSLIGKIVPFFSASRGPSLVLATANAIFALWVAGAIIRWRPQERSIRVMLWGFGPIVVMSFVVLLFIQTRFPELWSLGDALSGGRLSSSAFHTPVRDVEIIRIIGINFLGNVLLLIVGLLLLFKKKIFMLTLLLVIDMHVNTMGMLFFAPNAVYPTWSEIEMTKDDPTVRRLQHERVLIRNHNAPYTDFGAYWEALTVRYPFSDSYIDAEEMQGFDHLRRMRATFTPDWNMVYGISTITGYTSMLPQDVDARWNTTSSPAINNLPPIDPSNPLLGKWAVSYDLVDMWFPGATDRPDVPIATMGALAVYKRDGDSRIRMADGEPVIVSNLRETPNTIRFSLTSTRSGSLILADRFDPSWRVTVQGKPALIDNEHGLRKVAIGVGDQDIQFTYHPWRYFLGLALSLFTLLVASGFLIVQKLFKPSSK